MHLYFQMSLTSPVGVSQHLFLSRGTPQLLFPSLWESHDTRIFFCPRGIPTESAGSPWSQHCAARVDCIRCHVKIFSSVQLTVCWGSVEDKRAAVRGLVIKVTDLRWWTWWTGVLCPTHHHHQFEHDDVSASIWPKYVPCSRVSHIFHVDMSGY